MMLTDLSSSVIDEFMETGKCHYTSNYFQGENILVTEEVEAIIKTTEKKYGFLVYYVTENKTADGTRDFYHYSTLDAILVIGFTVTGI